MYKECKVPGHAIVKYKIDSSGGQSGAPLLSNDLDAEARDSEVAQSDSNIFTKNLDPVGVHHGTMPQKYQGYNIGTVITKKIMDDLIVPTITNYTTF